MAETPRRKGLWAALIGALCAVSAAASGGQSAAGNGKLPGVLGLYLENDVFAGTDSNYTSGLKAVWVSPEAGGGYQLPGWLDSLSRTFTPAKSPSSQRYLSISLGQSMYTPRDVRKFDPDPRDRPYAGFLCAGIGFYRRDDKRLDTVEIDAGVVGPHSMAQGAQKALHNLLHMYVPRGWGYQLRDEAVLGLVLDRMEKLRAPRRRPGLDGDVIAHSGVSLSNAFTGGMAGAEFRAGWNLPDDFGSSHIRPGGDGAALFDDRARLLSGPPVSGGHVFLAVEGQAVLRDVFLDGNTIHPGRQVEKFPLVGKAVAGLVLHEKGLKIAFGYVYESRRFKTQEGAELYGAFNISFSVKG